MVWRYVGKVNIIKKALGKKLISYDELQTIIEEVEGKVNSMLP